MKIEDLQTRLIQINSEIEAKKKNGWIREEHYRPWIERYNAIISQLNAVLKRDLPPKGIAATDFSNSGKTITDAALDSFQYDIQNIQNTIEQTLEKAEADTHRFHCFKIGTHCPHEIRENHYKFFVGMPFAEKYKDSYEYGIRMMLNTHGIDNIFKADEKFDRVDIMCKICRAIQESEYVIINITDQNPNVMFELGLAYGLNKYVFLIKDCTTPVVSDLKGLEYIEYSHAGDLNKKLEERLSGRRII